MGDLGTAVTTLYFELLGNTTFPYMAILMIYFGVGGAVVKVV